MDQTGSASALHLLLCCRAASDSGAFVEAVSAEAARFSDAIVRVGLAHRRSAAMQRGEKAALIERLLDGGLVSGTVRVTDFNAVLEIGAAEALTEAALRDLGARLGPWIDVERSVLHVGADHRLMTGDGDIELFFALRSVPDATRDEFHHWWRHELVAHTMHTPGKTGYRQVHADAARGRTLAAAAALPFDDFDGIAVERYPNLTEFFKAIDRGNRPDSESMRAERQMIDMSRARAIVTLVE